MSQPHFTTPVSLWQMLESWTHLQPEKIALCGPEGSISYQSFYEHAYALAVCLRDIGLEEGDVVGVALSRRLALPITFLAICGAGLTFMPLNPARSIEELSTLCLGMNVRALVLEAGTEEHLKACRPGRWTLGLDGLEADRSWEEAIAPGIGSKNYLNVPQDIRRVVYLNLTSGSTGQPRAAETTYEALYWNTRGMVEFLRSNQEEPFLCLFSPYAHPHEHFCRPLFLGGTSVLEPSNAPRRLLKTLQDHDVRSMMAVPSLYRVLCRSMTPGETYRRVRLLESGGAVADPSLLEQVQFHFQVPLCPVWGSTETVGVALATPTGEKPKPGCVGFPVPSYRATLAMTTSGQELVIEGPGLYQGYRLAQGQRMPRQGPHRTGDLFQQDEQGRFHFVGRMTSVLKVAGEKVHPEKVEAVLCLHQDISEALVLGILHDTKGQVPKAFLIPSGSSRPHPQALRSHCLRHLTVQETPKGFVWVTELPRLPGGKLDRKTAEAKWGSGTNP